MDRAYRVRAKVAQVEAAGHLVPDLRQDEVGWQHRAGSNSRAHSAEKEISRGAARCNDIATRPGALVIGQSPDGLGAGHSAVAHGDADRPGAYHGDQSGLIYRGDARIVTTPRATDCRLSAAIGHRYRRRKGIR